MDKKPDVLARPFHISEQLCLMNRENLLYGFQFQNDLIAYDQVDFVTTPPAKALVHNIYLTFERQPAQT